MEAAASSSKKRRKDDGESAGKTKKVLKKKKRTSVDAPEASKRKGDESPEERPKLKRKKKPAASSDESDSAEEDGVGLVAKLAKLVGKLAPEAAQLNEEWTSEAAAAAEVSGRSGDLQPQDEPAEILDNDDTFIAKQKKKKRKSAKAKAKAEEEATVAKPTGGPSSRDKGKKVWMGNLPWTLDEATFRADFAKFGEIERCLFPTDEAGYCQGFASLFYKDSKIVDKVVNLDNITYKGRYIRVKRRSPRRGAGQSLQRQRQAAERERESHRPEAAPAKEETAAPVPKAREAVAEGAGAKDRKKGRAE